METNLVYEIIGYAASLLVAVSLMMSAIVKLRVVNMIGAFTFAIYGVLIGSIPVAAMNGFIVLINVYYLIQIWMEKEYFQLLSVKKESEYLKAFIRFYKESIHTFQPGFSFDEEHNYSLFILRDMVPAGLIMGNTGKNGTLEIDLDFVIPDYRDFKIGEYLFQGKISYFKNQGIDKITTASGNEAHNNYLEKIGFNRSSIDPSKFELNIL